MEIAPHIITLGGCFIVCWVYFSSYRVPEGRWTIFFLAANCWMVDSSENRTLDHWAVVQSLCCNANWRRFVFNAAVSLGFFAGFCDFKSNSWTKRWLTVLLLTNTPALFNSALIFLAEHVGDFITCFFKTLSALGVVFLGRPLRFASL